MTSSKNRRLPSFIQEMEHIVALSGGKDSTAMALRLAEIEPRGYEYICTPTGDELPEMEGHWKRLEGILGKELIRLKNHDLDFWIEEFKALPNWRQRWCTRLLKITPCLAFLRVHQPATLYVGLRADEEERKGLYSTEVLTDFPLRRWGWGIKEVREYLKVRGVCIPRRTDCARCYDQRLIEWKRLWQLHPKIYAKAEAQEQRLGCTFRGPGRDNWPAPLVELRVAFASGRKVRGEAHYEEYERCRVCRM